LVLPAYDDLLQRSLFYRSWDGLEWELLGAIATAPAGIQPSVAQLSDGRLVSVMRNTDKGWLWAMASQDGGQSWSVPQDGGFANPNSPAAILGLASGSLLLVYNDSSTDRVRLTAALSADGGATWPCRRLLTEEGEHCSYPSVVQDADGQIQVLFSVGRERIDHITCNEAWIVQGGSAP
jgi:predicted neuraminidase